MIQVDFCVKKKEKEKRKKCYKTDCFNTIFLYPSCCFGFHCNHSVWDAVTFTMVVYSKSKIFSHLDWADGCCAERWSVCHGGGCEGVCAHTDYWCMSAVVLGSVFLKFALARKQRFGHLAWLFTSRDLRTR